MAVRGKLNYKLFITQFVKNEWNFLNILKFSNVETF